MENRDIKNLPKNEFNSIFWRSFALLGSFNYERMEGLGFLYAVMPSLKRIWGDDEEGYKAAMHRHIAAFNMTVAPSPFVMGLTVAMEEQAKEDKDFDVESINAVKVSLMGPLSGIGDTFFWGIFKVIATSLGVSFAMKGSFLGPIILLVSYNLPNFLTRYFGLKLGYSQGTTLMSNLQESGKMEVFTYCAGIIGMASIGAMVAQWVGIVTPLEFEISGSVIVVQDYLNEIVPELLSLTATLAIYNLLRKQMSMGKVIVIVSAVAFVLGILGIIA
ncbi:MAG TPA: PTS system mannose/fructose/sorbose family transporter subunit IID [Erysipelotrichaceae bacterium]|jgi:mannose/fructose/N-acetylgalactosamine-specific phosphotransferase system component IID|nr:PTS system mannose/fructose/sorbose family transporter subunit IID [Erysipelotrichaceae bacterium]HQA84602.1 PTS system mannose/fructose/sorbose family transporter subunit IID [Erysipelotrichaceae bacterium]